MALNLEGFILNPFAMIAVTIVLGGLFGKVNFRGLKLGSSGSLFVGLALGYIIYSVGIRPYETVSELPRVISENLVQGLVPKSLFTLSLIGFIAPVGLMASSDIADVVRRYGMRFVLLGFLITMSGALSSIICIKWLGNARSFGIIGTYVGALTSSPGLAAALETVSTSGKGGEALVGLGYAIGYIPGVLMVVLGMRLVPEWLGIDLASERLKIKNDIAKKNDSQSSESTMPFDVIRFMVICTVGILLGQVKVYFGAHLGWIGLGSTGGVLVASLIIGHLMKKHTDDLGISMSSLAAIRDISLNMFLAIVGLRYGYSTVTSIMSEGLVFLTTAFVSGLVAMTTGIIVGHKLMKMNWIVPSGVICGGMTSTPGLAAALETCQADEVAAGYGATYPIALISMIFFTTIMTFLA